MWAMIAITYQTKWNNHRLMFSICFFFDNQIVAELCFNACPKSWNKINKWIPVICA